MRELIILNRERMRHLNGVFKFQKREAAMIYPFDFQTYEEKDNRNEVEGTDEFGNKVKLKNKAFTSSAVGKMKFQKVDGMLNFESSMPSNMSKKWQRNL